MTDELDLECHIYVAGELVASFYAPGAVPRVGEIVCMQDSRKGYQVESVAWDVGYKDGSASVKLFCRRVTG